MKTTNTILTARQIEIAEKLLNEIQESGVNSYAEFMGLESAVSTDIQELTVSQISDAAEITDEEADVFLMAIAISDDGTLMGVVRALSQIVNAA